jgi:urease accessory protein
MAQAHVGPHGTQGFLPGVAHPLSGLDHICAMVAVGIWAAQRGGRALWMVPVTFVSVMMLGALLGMGSVSIPFVEGGIITSLLVLGVMVAAAIRIPLAASVALVGVFALFHGHAHGVEMPATASGVSYGLGFVVSTIALHLAGIGVGLAARKGTGLALAARYAGGAIAACGLYLCFS